MKPSTIGAPRTLRNGVECGYGASEGKDEYRVGLFLPVSLERSHRVISVAVEEVQALVVR